MNSRREYLILSAVASKTALAGCIGDDVVPGGNTADSGDTGEDEDGSNGEEENTEGEDNDGEDEQDEEDIEPLLKSEFEEVFEEMLWFENEYSSAVSQYRSQLNTAVQEIEDLLEPLQNIDMISVDEFDDAADIIEQSAENAVDAFEPQFENVYNFAALNRNRLPKIRRYVELSDWKAAEEELDELRSIYRSMSHSRAVDERHPDKPISNRLFDWFGGEADLYEFRYVGDETNHRKTGYDAPGFGRFVVEELDIDVRYEPFTDSPPYDSLVQIKELFSKFHESSERAYSVYIRIHNLDTDTDPETIDPREAETTPLFIQKYQSEEAAEAAFDSLGEEFTVDEELGIEGDTWRKLVFSAEEGRMYSYQVLSGEYLFVFGMARTIWEDRDVDFHGVLRDTFLLPSDDLEDSRIEDGWPL